MGPQQPSPLTDGKQWARDVREAALFAVSVGVLLWALATLLGDRSAAASAFPVATGIAFGYYVALQAGRA